MSAHVNRDLPFALARLGLVAPNGQSRSHDHFVINDMLKRVVQPLMAEEAKRFDPTIDDANDPLGITYSAVFDSAEGLARERLGQCPTAGRGADSSGQGRRGASHRGRGGGHRADVAGDLQLRAAGHQHSRPRRVLRQPGG